MKRLILVLAIAAWAAQVQGAVPEPKGVWEFDGPDPNAATIGASLELVGVAEPIAGLAAADGAIRIGEGSYYICTHGIAPNGGGTQVNEWTILIDFSYPPSSLSDPPSGYSDFFQTDPSNASDADWTINSSGAIGIGAVGYTSAYDYTTGPDTWYRMVVVVDNGTRHDVYIDGVEIFQGNEQGVDGRFSLAETLLLFCAGNNQDRDDAPIDVSMVAMWDTPLSAADIHTIGLAGDRFMPRKLAWDPTPADGADDVLRSIDLAWNPGEYAATHNVYFGSSADDVAAAGPGTLVAEGVAQDVGSLDVGRLDFGRTYYWRVDEVNGAPDFTVFEGKVWSFTVEPFAYAVENIVATSNGSLDPGAGPENTVNSSGLNANDGHGVESGDMWLTTEGADPLWIQYEFDRVYKLHEMQVWNYNVEFELILGFGLKDVTVEYSQDGVDWTVLGEVELAQATAREDYRYNTTVDFGGAAVKYVRLSVNSGHGMMGQYGLSEVRFLYVPAHARAPQPSDGATDVTVATELTWRAGREAVMHEVCFSGDRQAVADGTALVGAVEQNSYTPADLQFGTAYYWKINEVNEAEATWIWEGDLWSFTTQEFATIDDFEDYDNEENLIYETWIDGWTNETGSTVGYLEAPFAETSIVHSGRQSMPLEYINASAPYYSEAERDLGGADWTAGGAEMLRLHIQGSIGNGAGTLYVALEDSAGNVAVVTHPDETVLTTEAWQAWAIPFADFSGVNVAAVQTITLGVGDRNNPTAGGDGLIFVDDIAFGRPAETQGQ